MALAGTELTAALNSGAWKAYRDEKPITANDLKVSAHSVDVTLDRRLLRVLPNGRAIDPRDPDTMRTESVVLPNVPKGGFVLMPGDFVLGATRERFECSEPLRVTTLFYEGPDNEPYSQQSFHWTHFHGVYDGRSTTARLGLSSHCTSGYLDYAFSQTVTLEISSLLPVILFPGMRIGQISFNPIQGSEVEAYSGAYQQSEGGPVAAVLGKERF